MNGLIGLLAVLPAYADVYPSTGTAWVLPGGWTDPLATSYFDTSHEVKEWEAAHADVVFGSMQDVDINNEMIAMGYIYTQKLNCRPGRQSAWLSKHAAEEGIDMEDGFLHFSEDTRLVVVKASSGLDYLLKGKPYHLLLIRDNQFSTARLPLTLQPGDELVVFSSYPFDAFDVQATATPLVKRNITDDEGNIAGWKKLKVEWELNIGADKEGINQNLTSELTLTKPWQSAWPYYRHRKLNSGKAGLDNGLKTWMLKLSWAQETTLASLAIKPWLSLSAQQLAIPGWDGANDVDGDGYINDKEFATRRNTGASARFRHQSRLIPAGHMWPGTCWYRVNFTNKEFNDLHANWYREDWLQQGLSGAYNDDMAKLLGSNQFVVVSGGKISEMADLAGSEAAESEYALQLAAFLQLVKKKTQTQWLAANISELNLWHYSAWPPELQDVVDVWLREHYLTPAMGLQRLQRSWDSFALAKAGDKSLVMTSVKGGLSELDSSVAETWHRDIETGLALYYLFNLPGYTYYHSWNQTFTYGSGNTSRKNWYRQGVPKNWVYQPTAMLEVDIGQPTVIPKGYKVVSLDNKGDKVKSTASSISDIPIKPANWFWLYRTGWFGEPQEGVIARNYSDGLVLYRAVRERNDKGFLLAKPLRVSLPGEYQRVSYDGSLGEPARYIEVGGYEGIVLKKAKQP
ncbi:hypothetical protein [uncultured Photobacterium sp.]|uniref:hypothetical protein n=1 Tax=uncultured Photobacterium sp. TaxID=173973 RepID=UPI002629FB76|nr:hypothetical protein [uncultured Photobacterium sp.]